MHLSNQVLKLIDSIVVLQVQHSLLTPLRKDHFDKYNKTPQTMIFHWKMLVMFTGPSMVLALTQLQMWS